MYVPKNQKHQLTIRKAADLTVDMALLAPDKYLVGFAVADILEHFVEEDVEVTVQGMTAPSVKDQ